MRSSGSTQSESGRGVLHCAISTSSNSTSPRRLSPGARHRRKRHKCPQEPVPGTVETVTNRPQLRVTHAPVNVAGIPWENVQALRRKGVDARLVVFERGKLHPEADWSLDRRGSFLRRQATQWRGGPRRRPPTAAFLLFLLPSPRPPPRGVRPPP